MPEPEGFWARRGTRTEELTGTHCAGLLPTSRGAHAAREAPFDKGSQERRIEGAPLPVWGGCIHMAWRRGCRGGVRKTRGQTLAS